MDNSKLFCQPDKLPDGKYYMADSPNRIQSFINGYGKPIIHDIKENHIDYGEYFYKLKTWNYYYPVEDKENE